MQTAVLVLAFQTQSQIHLRRCCGGSLGLMASAQVALHAAHPLSFLKHLDSGLAQHRVFQQFSVSSAEQFVGRGVSSNSSQLQFPKCLPTFLSCSSSPGLQLSRHCAQWSFFLKQRCFESLQHLVFKHPSHDSAHLFGVKSQSSQLHGCTCLPTRLSSGSMPGVQLLLHCAQ